MDSSETDTGAERGNPGRTSSHSSIRRLDPIDGPRSLGAKRLALQSQKYRRTVIEWHVGIFKTADGTCVLISSDGTVAFAVAATESGLFVEKRHCLSSGLRTSHAMIFEDEPTFDRWCDIEPTCFDDPLLCDQLRRRGHEIFTAQR